MPQSGCFIIQLPRRVLRVYWLGYLPGCVFRGRLSGARTLVSTGLYVDMLRHCEHADSVSESSGSLFLHHLGLIKNYITCGEKKHGKNWNIMAS